jgi:hypothetical protein
MNVVERPLDRDRVVSDLDHDDVGERARDPKVLRPGAGHHDRHLGMVALGPEDPDLLAVVVCDLAGHELAQLGDDPLELVRLDRAAPERAHGVVAAAHAENDASGIDLGEGRVRVRDHRVVAGVRVRHGRAERQLLRRREPVRHVDEDVAPQELAVDEPRPRVAHLLGLAHRLGEDGQVARHELRADLHRPSWLCGQPA